MKLVRIHNYQKANESARQANCIQIAIAIILALTLFALLVNLRFLNKQIQLTQVLNQPLCAVKEIRVKTDAAKDIGISAVITNSGNYIAKNADVKWEFYLVEDLKKEKQSFKKIEGWVHATSKKSDIAIMPRQEFVIPLVIVKKERFDDFVRGYESAVGMTLSIDYTDMENRPQKYQSFFLITRLGPADSYDITMQESSINERQTELHDIQTQGFTIETQAASPNAVAVYPNKAKK